MALYVVLGPPAAGKSTWVREHAKASDIVIDYDVLAQALSGPGADAHDHHKAARTVAHQARSSAIAAALNQAGRVDVYIVHSEPRAEARAKYDRHHARYVVVDPGMKIVIERCRTERSPWTLAVAERWYATHSDMPQNVTASRSRAW